jgi:hypothetical protein
MRSLWRAFVRTGIKPALELAMRAANAKDVCLGGGAKAAQQYLAAGLVDEMEINMVPALGRAGGMGSLGTAILTLYASGGFAGALARSSRTRGLFVPNEKLQFVNDQRNPWPTKGLRELLAAWERAGHPVYPPCRLRLSSDPSA